MEGSQDFVQFVFQPGVFASLGASLVMGAFMLVQGVQDPSRRARFIGLACICFAIITVDFLQPQFEDKRLYERIRMVAWLFFCGAQISLLNDRRGLAMAVALSIGGLVLGLFLEQISIATTIVIPMAFFAVSLRYFIQHKETRGFASAVIAVCALTMGTACCGYFAHVRLQVVLGDPRIPMLGYLNFAVLTILQVSYGWVNIPRELRGQTTVHITFSRVVLYAVTMMGAQVVAMGSVLLAYDWPPVSYTLALISMVLATFILHFNYRHLLVIHTDNVARLLDERTESLRVARAELEKQNELQADQLSQQASELTEKAQVIERQRRLELAAQTTGQVAHDMQNLVAPILHQVQSLMHEDESAGSVQHAAKRIRRQVEQLLDVNGQMLALARRGRMDFQPTDISQLAYEVKEGFSDDRVQVNYEGVCWVNGAWSQLSRALSNLIRNALESGASSGSVVMVSVTGKEFSEDRRCHLGFLTAGDYVEISVSDKGEGIPDDCLNKVFDPFYSSKHRGGSGTGLGLSIVSAVVEDHGGVVDLETGPSGTIFSIFLPAIAAPISMFDPESVSGNETILVADDDRSTREYVAKQLEAAGYHVMVCSSGTEALKSIQKIKVDLQIMDLNMPGMTGYEALFGAIHVSPGIPAIVHTSYVTESESIKLQQLGIVEFLIKPASPQDLLASVRRVLDAVAT